MSKCHHCETAWPGEGQRPGFKELCERCGAYLHCCRNCRFYDKTKHNACAVGTTELVGDKVGFNYCDEFRWRRDGASDRSEPQAPEARGALDALFGDEEKPASLDDFKKLFGD